jgi:hypothetical protein
MVLLQDDGMYLESSFISFVESSSELFPPCLSLKMVRHVMVMRSSDKERTNSLFPTSPSAQTGRKQHTKTNKRYPHKDTVTNSPRRLNMLKDLEILDNTPVNTTNTIYHGKNDTHHA